MPGEIIQGEDSPRIVVENTETREILTLNPELVVLSVGMQPAKDAGRLAESLGITLSENGFYESENYQLNPVGTVRQGIYIAGAACAPKDIPDSVTQGEAAAMKAFRDAVTY